MGKIWKGWEYFFTGDEKGNSGLKEKKKAYEIPKEDLLKALGLKDKNISFIQYDWKKKVLLITEELGGENGI